jgi:hypothetical protein
VDGGGTQAEISYRIKLLTPSGGAFIPITQTEVMKYLTRLPMRIMEQYDTGQLISIATTDIEKMDAVIVAMFLIITQSVDIVLQVAHHTTHKLHAHTSPNPPNARLRLSL